MVSNADLCDDNGLPEKKRPPPVQTQMKGVPRSPSNLSDCSSPIDRRTPGPRTSISKSSGMLREIMYINPPSRIDDFYDFGSILGHGGYGVVSEILHAKTFQAFAGKVSKKASLKTTEGEEMYRQVVALLLNSDSSSIVKLIQLFEDDAHYYMVMQKCAGTLVKLVNASERNKYPNAPYILTAERAADFCGQILSGVNFLHSHRMLHRDIKPDNILVENPYETSEPNFGGISMQLKIVDFDMCIFLPDDKDVLTMDDICGTACYMAPEILSRSSYSAQSDIFAIGATMYFLVTESLPCPGISLSPRFKTSRLIAMMSAWASEINDLLGDPAKVADSAWGRLPPEGVAALRMALAPEPSDRWPSCKEMLHSKWLVTATSPSDSPCSSVQSQLGHPLGARRNSLPRSLTVGSQSIQDASRASNIPTTRRSSKHNTVTSSQIAGAGKYNFQDLLRQTEK